MIIQSIIVTCIVTGAMFFLIQRFRKAFTNESGACGSDCGCAGKIDLSKPAKTA